MFFFNLPHIYNYRIIRITIYIKLIGMHITLLN